jgi:hypothetical protein
MTSVVSAQLLNSIPFAELFYKRRTGEITYDAAVRSVAFAIYQDRVRREHFSLPDSDKADWRVAQELIRQDAEDFRYSPHPPMPANGAR